MRLALFNVRFSPNLGDGILSLCLEGELLKCGKNIAVECHDLAGGVVSTATPEEESLRWRFSIIFQCA